MQVELFKSWADTVLILITGAFSIYSIFVVRKAKNQTIKQLKEQIDAIKKSNESAVSLTNAQSTHLDTYKKMFDLEHFKNYTDMRVTNAVSEFLNNNPDMKKLYMEAADEIINKEILSCNTEFMIFIYYMLNDVIKFDKETQFKIIRGRLPKGGEMLINTIYTFPEITGIQKNQNG